jgi:hypothetical protein
MSTEIDRCCASSPQRLKKRRSRESLLLSFKILNITLDSKEDGAPAEGDDG